MMSLILNNRAQLAILGDKALPVWCFLQELTSIEKGSKNCPHPLNEYPFTLIESLRLYS